MLNKNNERELAYIVKVDNITPMDADRLECAHVGGWRCVVGKGEFNVGDYAIYFEIDSKLPEVEPFTSMEFLKSKHYKIKSQRIRGVVSQGLLMPLSAFADNERRIPSWLATVNLQIASGNDVTNTFLTKEIGVTYAVFEDNGRKAPSVDKYKKMTQRNQKIAKTFWWRWLYNKNWGKKVLFFFFGKKRDNKTGWPAWVVKTDEERCQNMPWLFTEEKVPWIATEKIDGTSTTFTMKGFGRKRQFYVCSRNVVFDKPDKKCFYETNFYTQMAEKYDIENVLSKMLDENKSDNIDFITIQGETFGAGVQKRDYNMNDQDFYVFNIIYGYKNGTTVRLNPIAGTGVANEYGLKFVPVIGTYFILPNTCQELLDIATGKSQIDGGMREGLVFRSVDGQRSFKAVSNDFLLKYHQ